MRTSGVPCRLRKRRWRRRPAVKEKSSALFCGLESRIRDKDWFLECIGMYGSPSMPASKDLSSILFAGNHPQEQLMSSSGLLRYQSAPSSLLGELREDFLPVSSPCPETATSAAMFCRFLAQDIQIRDGVPPGGGGAVTNQPLPQFTTPASAERSGALFSPASQQNHHHHQQQQQQQLTRVMEQTNSGGGASSSNLVRHRSSPAGVLSHLNANAGYPNTSKNQISFSSIQNPIMSQISEVVIAGSSSDDSGGYIPRFPSSNWENFSRGKNAIDDLNPTELEARNHVPTLPHQFSFPPKPSPEMATMENYLHFQDSVPCKIRAKRGCATHPRSIAERVRRTKISERIKKLQELVPNMDTQTNTADMLGLAISYINDLQEQVQTLSESRSSCTCSSGKQKQDHPSA